MFCRNYIKSEEEKDVWKKMWKKYENLILAEPHYMYLHVYILNLSFLNFLLSQTKTNIPWNYSTTDSLLAISNFSL